MQLNLQDLGSLLDFADRISFDSSGRLLIWDEEWRAWQVTKLSLPRAAASRLTQLREKFYEFRRESIQFTYSPTTQVTRRSAASKRAGSKRSNVRASKASGSTT